jgi:hypothetical protein
LRLALAIDGVHIARFGGGGVTAGISDSGAEPMKPLFRA